MQNCLKYFFTFLFILINVSPAFAVNKFYNDRERGWYFHESFDNEIKKEKKTNKQKLNNQTEQKLLRDMSADQVLQTLADVQKEMQVRQARYILEPTLENTRDFLEYQQIMFRHGKNASESMKTTLLKYPNLDPSIQNPVSQQAAKIHNIEENTKNDQKILEFARHFKLIYFFKSDCPYCTEFSPVLMKVAKNYQFQMEAISSDGKNAKDLALISTRLDSQLVAKLDISTYPTVIAYNEKNNIYLPVSRGFMPAEDFKLNIVHIYGHILKLSMEKQGE